MKNASRLLMLILYLISCNNLSHGASELSEYEKFPNSKELPQAARDNNIQRVQELLKSGYNINSTWYKPKWTPLMEITDFGHQNLLNSFIQNFKQKLEIDQQDDYGRTALMYTVFTGTRGRTNGKPGEETKDLAYPLLNMGADYTIQLEVDLCFVNLIEKLNISDQEKKTMKEKSKQIVQNRWNTICSMWDANKISKDLILFFFSFLYEENKDELGINKGKYFERVGKKRKHFDSQDDHKENNQNDHKKKKKGGSK